MGPIIGVPHRDDHGLLDPDCRGRDDGRRPVCVTAFVIGVPAPDNLTIISMTGAGDLENLDHIVNGALLLTIGLLSSGRHPGPDEAAGFG